MNKIEDDNDDMIPELIPISKPQYEKENANQNQKPKYKLIKQEKPVPVTLITGYLGSGKTTLVNYILKSYHGYRIAVIINEFGDTAGIEKSMFKGPEDEESEEREWLELTNGCLCCSVKSDFVKAIEGLMREKKGKFDYILIETSGLANPGPVASSLWTDVDLEAGVCLDAIVTVVDGRNIINQLDKNGDSSSSVNEAQRQIAYADIVILNKMDLIDESNVIKERIKSINETVDIITSIKCNINLSLILDKHVYNINEEKFDMKEMCDENHKHDDKCHHSYKNEVSTVVITIEKPLLLNKIEDLLDNLLWQESAKVEDIFRIKGLLNVSGQKQKYILQAVHELYDITEGALWHETEIRFTKIVFIGKDLNKSVLKRLVENCQI